MIDGLLKSKMRR
jgi:hypothetical protein